MTLGLNPVSVNHPRSTERRLPSFLQHITHEAVKFDCGFSHLAFQITLTRSLTSQSKSRCVCFGDKTNDTRAAPLVILVQTETENTGRAHCVFTASTLTHSSVRSKSSGLVLCVSRRDNTFRKGPGVRGPDSTSKIFRIYSRDDMGKCHRLSWDKTVAGGSPAQPPVLTTSWGSWESLLRSHSVPLFALVSDNNRTLEELE